jgi:hypothetical protein
MATKKHGIIVETPDEVRLAEPGRRFSRFW